MNEQTLQTLQVERQINQEPWLAVNLSRLIPGLGQIYIGSTIKGLIILASYFFLIGLGVYLIINSSGNFLVGLIMFIATWLLLPIWNFFDAYYSTTKENTSEFEFARKQSRDAWLAVFLSGFIPGLGHAYLKKWLIAIVFFVFSPISFILPIAGLISGNPIKILSYFLFQLVYIFILFYSVYVSASVARQRQRRAIKRFIAGFMAISISMTGPSLSLVLPIAIRTFVVEARYIVGISMQPAIKDRDRLIVNKLAYKFREPESGDIILFSGTQAFQKQTDSENNVVGNSHISRIIAEPRDKVQLKDGALYINDRPLPKTDISKGETTEYQWGPEFVPANSYLIFSDNWEYSTVSLDFVIPRKNIIGRVTKRFYPWNRAASLTDK